jgi:hypothetical protein
MIFLAPGAESAWTGRGQYLVPDKPTPAGCERIVARSDRELGQIEKMTGTLNHSRWYDNNGRGFDDYYNGSKVTH